MTVYVDDMNAEFRPPHRPGIVYVMCHMVGDDEAELHKMAASIGVARNSPWRSWQRHNGRPDTI